MQLHYLYYSLNINRMIERNEEWGTSKGEFKYTQGFFVYVH